MISSASICVNNPLQGPPAVAGALIAPQTYYAASSLYDRVARVANGVLFAASAGAVFVLATGGSALLVGASYVCLALALRKMVQVVLGYAAYPAALISKLSPLIRRLGFSVEPRPHLAAAHKDFLVDQGFDVQSVRLVKGGVTYDACAVFKPGQENNKWRLRALGNECWYEQFLLENTTLLPLQFEFDKLGFNTLFVNGPSVGQSGGLPTRYQLGAAFEAGLQYLETEKRASHILLHGWSLGGGMLSEAILQHDWTCSEVANTRYLMVSERSFSRLSDAAAEFICGRRTILHRIAGAFVRALFWISGQELDGFSAGKKLERLQRENLINHIVIQSPMGDEAISQGANLTEDGPLGSFVPFLESRQLGKNGAASRVTLEAHMGHMDCFPAGLMKEFNEKVAAFAEV